MYGTWHRKPPLSLLDVNTVHFHFVCCKASLVIIVYLLHSSGSVILNINWMDMNLSHNSEWLICKIWCLIHQQMCFCFPVNGSLVDRCTCFSFLYFCSQLSPLLPQLSGVLFLSIRFSHVPEFQETYSKIFPYCHVFWTSLNWNIKQQKSTYHRSVGFPQAWLQLH